MSRTDKDMPWWVRAEWWEPWHHRCDAPDTERKRGWWGQVRPCDLPAAPVVKGGDSFPRFSLTRSCQWVAIWDLNHYPGPDHEYIRLVWNGPQRRSVRDDCRRAVGEYNATGDTDVEPSTRQSRDCAKWLWSR